jgi:hypothetical protein
MPKNSDRAAEAVGAATSDRASAVRKIATRVTRGPCFAPLALHIRRAKVTNAEDHARHTRVKVPASAQLSAPQATHHLEVGLEDLVALRPQRTVNVRLAGVASVFLALSVARTSKLWEPAESGVEPVWLAPGPEHAANAWESQRHWKVEPESLEAKLNVGVRSEVGPEARRRPSPTASSPRRR